MRTQTQTMTADDLLRMPDDGVRRELVQGELREMVPAGHRHGRVAMKIGARLAEHVEVNDLGEAYAAETGFILASDPDTVRAPDAAFVRRERLKDAEDVEGFFPGAPDLAVEVVSPGDAYAEVEAKVADWLEAGTPMVMVVNPVQRTVKVYRGLNDVLLLRETDDLDGGSVVPGWSVPVVGRWPASCPAPSWPDS